MSRRRCTKRSTLAILVNKLSNQASGSVKTLFSMSTVRTSYWCYTDIDDKTMHKGVKIPEGHMQADIDSDNSPCHLLVPHVAAEKNETPDLGTASIVSALYTSFFYGIICCNGRVTSSTTESLAPFNRKCRLFSRCICFDPCSTPSPWTAHIPPTNAGKFRCDEKQTLLFFRIKFVSVFFK